MKEATCRAWARLLPILVLSVVIEWGTVCGAEPRFTVATYNLENYILEARGTRPMKSEASRAQVVAVLKLLDADVLALQEVGGTNALAELRSRLKAAGIEYPEWELVTGYDTNIQVAVLSKFPIRARHPHSDDGFLMGGRRVWLTRGIAEVDIQVRPDYGFTLLVAHLKSRRPAAEADEAEWREQEAIILREKIDGRLRANPKLNLLAVGDLNDVRDSRTLRTIVGRGPEALLDLRPAERNGERVRNPRSRLSAREITWTHFFAKEDSYSRFDYILASRGMAREWEADGTYVWRAPNWGLASDHRPIIATFLTNDR